MTEAQHTTGRRGPDRAAVVVWLLWALTLTSLLGAIARDGRNVPFEEDWLLVGPMTGHEPNLPAWLWSQNSEHRLPLPRLVNLAILRTTGDFRWTMVFDTLAVGAVAAAMILLARRLRGGRTSLADAFFPLLLQLWPSALFLFFLAVRTPEEAGADAVTEGRQPND